MTIPHFVLCEKCKAHKTVMRLAHHSGQIYLPRAQPSSASLVMTWHQTFGISMREYFQPAEPPASTRNEALVTMFLQRPVNEIGSLRRYASMTRDDADGHLRILSVSWRETLITVPPQKADAAAGIATATEMAAASKVEVILIIAVFLGWFDEHWIRMRCFIAAE
jgi:hypothetical protein